MIEVRKDDNKVTSVDGILAANSKLVAKSERSWKVDGGMLFQLKI